MITLELARSLRTAGLTWTPASGDRFVIDMPDLTDQTFVLSDLTVDVHDIHGEQVLGFNGTVEWALDSVTAGPGAVAAARGPAAHGARPGVRPVGVSGPGAAAGRGHGRAARRWSSSTTTRARRTAGPCCTC